MGVVRNSEQPATPEIANPTIEQQRDIGRGGRKPLGKRKLGEPHPIRQYYPCRLSLLRLINGLQPFFLSNLFFLNIYTEKSKN